MLLLLEPCREDLPSDVVSSAVGTPPGLAAGASVGAPPTSSASCRCKWEPCVRFFSRFACSCAFFFFPEKGGMGVAAAGTGDAGLVAAMGPGGWWFLFPSFSLFWVGLR